MTQNETNKICSHGHLLTEFCARCNPDEAEAQIEKWKQVVRSLLPSGDPAQLVSALSCCWSFSSKTNQYEQSQWGCECGNFDKWKRSLRLAEDMNKMLRFQVQLTKLGLTL